MALEDMHLDRKADFEGDAYDPFKVGRSMQNAFGSNLELSAQQAYLAKVNSAGG